MHARTRVCVCVCEVKAQESVLTHSSIELSGCQRMPMFMCDVKQCPGNLKAQMPQRQSWHTDDRLHCRTAGGGGGVRTLTSTECRVCPPAPPPSAVVCPPAPPPSAVVCSAPLSSATGCRRVGSRTPGKVATSFKATDVRARLISYGCGRVGQQSLDEMTVCVCVRACVLARHYLI